jgi:hypothetical protein
MKGDTSYVIMDHFTSRYAETVRVLAEEGGIGGGNGAPPFVLDAAGR